VENSIKEDIKIAVDKFSDNKDIDSAMLIVEKFILGNYILLGGNRGNIVKDSLRYILSDYKRVLKENEELTISNKEIDKECSRLEKKEIELINENEHYKDLIYALKTYYDITEEDLEKCMKNDR
jgi:hypothetical protein